MHEEREEEVTIKYQTTIRCATRILKKALDSSLLRISRVIHKLWEFTQRKNNFKLSEKNVLKIDNNGLILCRIKEGDIGVELKSWRCSK